LNRVVLTRVERGKRKLETTAGVMRKGEAERCPMFIGMLGGTVMGSAAFRLVG